MTENETKMKTLFHVSATVLAVFALAGQASADKISFADIPSASPSSQFRPAVHVAGVPEPGPSGGIVPFALSIIPPAQLPPEDWDVYGIRVNLFVGRHRDVGFVDLGVFGNRVDGNLSGIEGAFIYNMIGESDGAIQLAGLFNDVRRDFCGLQAAFLVNRVDGDMTGIEMGLVNLVQDGAGLQAGFFNRAERFSGLQLGVFNYARQLDGVQVGVLNVIEDSSVPCLPVLNVAF